MAWIAKASSTEKIERRAEPYVTAQMKAAWEKDILPRYATKHGALMPILHEVQHAYRQIPYQAMIEIAQFLSLKPADVLDTVTFYEEFTTEKMGECVIGICQSIACEICGHNAILNHVRKRLNLEPHETSDDGKFTLLAMECLGSCGTAPVALFNDTLYENLTIEGVDRLIDAAQKSSSGSGHA
jgi:NADH-quinone oxidoreductase subunit E